jgi:hypothetical protein
MCAGHKAGELPGYYSRGQGFKTGDASEEEEPEASDLDLQRPTR